MRNLIVGLGSMGRRRARLIAALPGAHTICGVDSAPARRQEAEEGGIPAYASIGEALRAGPYDAAFVCTAPLSHAAVTGQLLDAGLPVFSEINLVDDGYDELMHKAAQKGLVLFLSSTMLYRAETQYITRQVQDFGGPVRYLYHIGQYLPDWHPWESYQNFFVGDRRTGGVREILGIEMPWLTHCFGEVASLHAEQSSLSGLALPYADSLTATLRHQNGARGVLAVDVVSPRAVRRFEVFGEGLHLFWEGSPDSLGRYDPETRQLLPVQVYEQAEQDSRYSDNIVENAYRDEILNFYGVLQGRETPRWSFARDAEVIQAMDRIEADAAQNG